jgi:hypothetical protein
MNVYTLLQNEMFLGMLIGAAAVVNAQFVFVMVYYLKYLDRERKRLGKMTFEEYAHKRGWGKTIMFYDIGKREGK